MFRDALDYACEFTFPVIQFCLTMEGKCSAGAAAFIVINPKGWIITAAHVMKDAVTLATSDRNARIWEAQRAAILANQALSAKERQRQLDALGKHNKKAARRGYSLWYFNNVTLRDVSILEEIDLAVARLDGFQPNWVSRYPSFKRPDDSFRVGASLCKLGYPFAEFVPTYDDASNTFSLNQMEVTFFPIEGMFTRVIEVPPPAPAPPFQLKFVETSSPGLRGQSGGPTFDTNGHIWAVQSQTRHLPLGFSPEIRHNGQTHKEHQFLNVGMGVHAETVLGFLNQLGVRHSVA